jgi:hypothetical protein
VSSTNCSSEANRNPFLAMPANQSTSRRGSPPALGAHRRAGRGGAAGWVPVPPAAAWPLVPCSRNKPTGAAAAGTPRVPAAPPGGIRLAWPVRRGLHAGRPARPRRGPPPTTTAGSAAGTRATSPPARPALLCPCLLHLRRGHRAGQRSARPEDRGARGMRAMGAWGGRVARRERWWDVAWAGARPRCCLPCRAGDDPTMDDATRPQPPSRLQRSSQGFHPSDRHRIWPSKRKKATFVFTTKVGMEKIGHISSHTFANWT